jgi:hypothetical protein
VEVLTALGVEFIIQVKGSTKVYVQGQWGNLNTLRFVGNARQRKLGRLAYCESSPHRLWVTMGRAREANGTGSTLENSPPRNPDVAGAPSPGIR